MARKRRLKKGGGDLEAHQQNVASSKQTIGKQTVDLLELGLGEQNVVPSKLQPKEQNVTSSEFRIDESSNVCDLKSIMVIVCNLNGEITLNID